MRLQQEFSTLHHGRRRLESGVAHALERTTRQLDHLATRQRLLDPARVLARGFAVVRDDGGRVLPSATRLQPQQRVTVLFRDGSATTRIETVHRDPT
jgi:exodeoxyribonuclease VII large subunit